MNKDYLISIITVSLNQGKFIEENILSVINQTYKNIEHIIVDGGSSDETIEILKKYPHLIWISEKDSGQSEAFNKGIKMSKGDLILFLNSDDYLYSVDALHNVVIKINDYDFNIYSSFMANTYVVDNEGNIKDQMIGCNMDFDFNTLLNVFPKVIHPSTFFIRNKILETDMYDEKLHFNMDYDFFLKLSKTNPIHSIDIFTSVLRQHYDSKGCGKNNWKFSKEFLIVRKKHNGNMFSKLNIQPIKEITFHFIGERNIEFLKRFKIVHLLAKITGIKKINKVSWHINK